MFGFGILSGLIFLPLVGAAFILLQRGDDEATRMNVRWAALATTIVTFLLSLWAWKSFDTASAAFQLVEEKPWAGLGLVYKLGVDGMSMPFVILTTFLMPFCILASWESIQTRVKEYFVAFLVLETLMIGVFCALDLVLFYLFFEGGLIPMFLIIGVWGGKRRIYASFKFFLYTLIGSLLMLLAIMAMYGVTGTTDITVLLKTNFPAGMQKWLWVAFFVWTLSIIAIIYTSLVALVQEDMKKLIAYSSVAHMGFVTMGLFSMNQQGVQGAVFQMVSHGLVSGALFLCVGVVYDRLHTREIAAYGGLVKRMPLYAVAFMLFTMANVGLPGTSGFVGEFLTLIGAFGANTWVAFFATFGVILSAAYALYLYRRVIFGVLDKPSLMQMNDLSLREVVLLLPLGLLTLYYGVHPGPILDACAASVDQLIKGYDAALAVTKTAALALH